LLREDSLKLKDPHYSNYSKIFTWINTYLEKGHNKAQSNQLNIKVIISILLNNK
jgi:hypothetical protein